MNQYNHYEEAKSIITMLSGTSLENYCELLQNSIREGSTGTEIFMALKWNIENLLNEERLDEAIKARAKGLWSELDKALN